MFDILFLILLICLLVCAYIAFVCLVHESWRVDEELFEHFKEQEFEWSEPQQGTEKGKSLCALFILILQALTWRSYLSIFIIHVLEAGFYLINW